MHRFVKAVLFAAALAVFPLALAACSGSGGASGGGANVAATVNGKNITLAEVDTIITQQAPDQSKNLSPLERATARLQVLDGLIQQEVLFQRAEKDNLLPKDEEVTQAINSKKQEMRLTEEEYQKMLREGGQTEEQLRETARRQLAIENLLRKTVGNVTVRDNEVEAFYNANKERFISPRGVAVSAIFADPRDAGGQLADDAKGDLEAKAKIDNIYQQLRNGADFADVARNRSEDESLVRGGEMGFWDESRLRQAGIPAEVVASLFGAMQVGSYTNPIRLQDNRYMILKLTDRRLQDQAQTLETPGVRDQIKQALINERQRVLGEALKVVAMNEAKVENHLAQSMLKDPSMLGGMQPVAPGEGSAQGAATPAPAASPAAANTPAPGASPAAAASPGAAASPATGASPAR
ncbi:MAG TPA: SurA N-terminal domain-containing protein [Pyrinomonadaceae bacterium]|nr:SurA N-terminal domain-containing protein [Pyrinomonadaceae bacterium]